MVDCQDWMIAVLRGPAMSGNDIKTYDSHPTLVSSKNFAVEFSIGLKMGRAWGENNVGDRFNPGTTPFLDPIRVSCTTRLHR